MESTHEWYYVVEEEAGNRQEGPVSTDVLVSMLAAGTVVPETLVWREGMADWQPASAVEGLSEAVPAEVAPAEAATAGETSIELPGELFDEPADVPPVEPPPGPGGDIAAEAPAPEPAQSEPQAAAAAPGGEQDQVTIRDYHAYSVSYSRSRRCLLIVTNEYHADPLALTKLDLLRFLTAMEEQEQ